MSNFKYFKEELSVFLLDARKPLICIETSDWLFVKDRMKEVIKGIDDHGNGQNALDIKSIYVWDAVESSPFFQVIFTCEPSRFMLSSSSYSCLVGPCNT